MELKFISCGSQNHLSRNYSITNEEEEDIGSVEGYLGNYGQLVTVIKIYNPKYQQQGLGYIAFKKVFDELNLELPITTIVGSWHRGGEFIDFEEGMSTNLKEFLQCQEKGGKPEECASQTPTGKWASRLGYKQCKIVRSTYDEVTVHFIKGT